MGSKIIQADQEDIRKIEKEESTVFIFDILARLRLPEEEVLPCLPTEGLELSVQQKIALRNLCTKRNMAIVDDFNGGLKIYANDVIIAEWKKPVFFLKVDRNAIDRTKRLYVEIHCSWWSAYEGKNEQAK